ncbi:LPXTG cell wall anchor domain-containing protein [Lactiplantibacillus plantarum]|nr:LPXTG cell wall anchor domain-containing protein [Lactiplantibacillus plantarum]
MTPETPMNPKTPETPMNPKTPETPKNPKTPETPMNPKTPETPTNPKTPKIPDTPGISKNLATKTHYSNESSINKSKSLPQTGEQNNGFLMTLGAVFLSIMSAITFGYISKRKKEN